MTETLRVAVRRFGPFETAIVRQFEDFARAQNVDARIEAEPLDLNPLHAALFGRAELLTPRWDIAFLPTDWIAEAAARGLVEDLRPWMTRSPMPDFPQGWSPSLLGLQDHAGGFWGMPYHDGPQCLIWRTDLLAGAGLAVPTSWEAFHAAARRLHDPASGVYGTVLALYPDGHNGFYDFCVHLWTRGGAPFDVAGRPDLLTPAAESALDFIRTLAADRDAVAPDLRTIDSVRAGMMFCEGRVALMTNWFGFAAFGETWKESRVAARIDVAPLPAGPGGDNASLNVYWVLAIARGSGRKALAWEFLRHCASAAMDRVTMLEGAIGVRRSTWADPEINRIVPYAHKLELLHRHARQLPAHPRLSEIAHAIDDMMGEAVTSDRASRELLAQAQARIAAIVA
ncbi:MAG TPA: extracellular solute-binding protein [Acetobacteraceae bacterium]|nr:extracellular solute-binding protein [Acetobacteraceae bacterium]